MLTEKHLQHLGAFSKTHGFSGALVLLSDRILDDELENLTELFVVIDGLRVPFPVEEFTIRTDCTALVRMEFVTSVEEATELIDCEVLADVVLQATEAGLEQWTGYAVHDSQYGNIGCIAGIEDFNGNIVMQVVQDGKETLISLYPELVTEVDVNSKILHINAPEGILSLN
ncbi:ribosome maturation factor RimM [Bacteroidia bacterium]|nr:ribosome maturation factor RimM [Bacteroidia bacterium]GHT78928.1 ribosome maturation factor RimM [Bacteroidia bacterium]